MRAGRAGGAHVAARKGPATRPCQNPPMLRLAIALLLAVLLPCSSAAAAPVPETAMRVLIFSKTATFRHDSIPTAIATVRRLAEEQGMQADASEDPAAFTDAALARYRVVVFANTTGEVLDAAQQAAFERFIRAGGGFVGIHSAADTGYEWPWYGKLVAAYFGGHPPGLQGSRVQPERDGRPDGEAWPVRDELYNYRSNPRGQVQVLATIDEKLYEGGTMGADHPIAWCHAFDGGRAWYTGLGHDAAIYADPHFLAQLRGGLRYAAGIAPGC